jgi:hypothetical protein
MTMVDFKLSLGHSISNREIIRIIDSGILPTNEMRKSIWYEKLKTEYSLFFDD